MPSTYEPIATFTASGSSGTITFSSIPSTYTDVLIVFGGSGAGAGAGQDVTVLYNNDTGSNYSFTRIYGDGSTAVSSRGSSQSSIPFTIGGVGTNSNNLLSVQNYSNATTNKTSLNRVNQPNFVGAIVALWRNTAAINRIDLVLSGGFNYTTGSTFTLYGIKAA